MPDPITTTYKVGDVVPFHMLPGLIIVSYIVSLVGSVTTVELLHRRKTGGGWLSWYVQPTRSLAVFVSCIRETQLILHLQAAISGMFRLLRSGRNLVHAFRRKPRHYPRRWFPGDSALLQPELHRSVGIPTYHLLVLRLCPGRALQSIEDGNVLVSSGIRYCGWSGHHRHALRRQLWHAEL